MKRHVFHVAEALRARGDDVTVAGPLGRGDPGAGFRGFGGVVNVAANGSDNYLGILTSPWAVRRFFKAGNFDLVHIHEPLTPLLPYYALWFSPAAAHVCTFHMYAEHEGNVSRAVRRLLGRALLGRFERGIAVSKPAEQFAKEAWPRPLTLVPNGVPTNVFRPKAAEDASRGEGPLRLLFVGHWRDPRKGLRHLLGACDLVRQDGVRVTLDVVGDGGQDAAPGPGVTFHGPVSSETLLAEHYRNCDVFVAPATGQESFGIVLLEAMACARPIVCSDIPGFRQVVEADGARFCTRGDLRELARAIVDLARQPALRREMGAANRRRAEGYDWGRLAERIRDEYVAAIAARRCLSLVPAGPLPTAG